MVRFQAPLTAAAGDVVETSDYVDLAVEEVETVELGAVVVFPGGSPPDGGARWRRQAKRRGFKTKAVLTWGFARLAWLGGEDSNPQRLDQNQLCYRLHHPRMGGPQPYRTARRGRTPAFNR